MKLITFGLGGAKALFLRLGFGASAVATQARVDGGVLRGQFKPAIFSAPILLDVHQVSRVRVRVRFTSTTEVACRVSRVHPIIGAGGYVRGSRGERAYRQLQRRAKDLNVIAGWLNDLCKRSEKDRTMTKGDRQLLTSAVAFLAAAVADYRGLASALSEPRHLKIEAAAYEVLQRHAREQQDVRDVRDVLAL